MHLTSQEIQNIMNLIGAAPIKGAEALAVALLQQKLNAMMLELQTSESEEVEPKPEESKDGSTKPRK